MKQIIILLLTIIVSNAYGQRKQKEGSSSDFKKVQFGINFSPDICFRTLQNNDGSVISNAVLNQNNENETMKVGYTTGLNICYNITEFRGIETGIQYSNKGYQTIMKDLIYFHPDPSLPTKSKFVYNFHYIDIPLKANFTFGKNKVRFFTSFGVTINFFIKETQTNILEYSDGKTDQKTQQTTFDYNKVDVTPTVSVGFDYRINNGMNLRVEPTFRYGVLKIIDTPVTGYLWSGGLNISYYFGL